jgi:hypothetical protein
VVLDPDNSILLITKSRHWVKSWVSSIPCTFSTTRIHYPTSFLMLSFTPCCLLKAVRYTFAPSPGGMCYLTTLSVSEGVGSNGSGINENTDIRKEAVVAWSWSYCLGVCLEWVRGTTKSLIIPYVAADARTSRRRNTRTRLEHCLCTSLFSSVAHVNALNFSTSKLIIRLWDHVDGRRLY